MKLKALGYIMLATGCIIFFILGLTFKSVWLSDSDKDKNKEKDD